MELNNYQKQVMRDLSAYLNCVNRSTNLFSAWREYWFSKMWQSASAAYRLTTIPLNVYLMCV